MSPDDTDWIVPYANRRIDALFHRTLAKTAKRKAQLKLARDRWRKANLEYIRTRDAHRRALKRAKVPAWANLDLIAEIYQLCALATRLMGQPYEVDHIVPLKSSKVCGLHVEANLQIVLRRENRTKRNSFWPDMPTDEPRKAGTS